MDIQTLEGYSLRAWPALHEDHYDGWLLRFTNGYTSRANSVNPLYGSMLDIETKLRHCEAEYTRRGLSPRFKLTPAAYPADLDHLLEARGYERQTPSQMMTVDLAQLPPAAPPPAVRIVDEADLSDDWLTAYMRLSGVRPDYLDTVRALLRRIAPQTFFSSARRDDQIVAVTLGVREGEMIGLFDVVTQTDQRGQGIGTALVTHVLKQGVVNGARTGYLQVLGSNANAIRLYTRLGFQVSYPYWYRVKIG